MPIFEYRCTDEKCAHVTERLVRRPADVPLECPVCAAPVKKKVSAASFHLAGGGWAKDGYAK